MKIVNERFFLTKIKTCTSKCYKCKFQSFVYKNGYAELYFLQNIFNATFDEKFSLEKIVAVFGWQKQFLENSEKIASFPRHASICSQVFDDIYRAWTPKAYFHLFQTEHSSDGQATHVVWLLKSQMHTCLQPMNSSMIASRQLKNGWSPSSTSTY